MDAMNELKTPMANKITTEAKARSTALSGTMLFVAGVNCVRDQ